LRVRGGGSKDFYGSNLDGEVLSTQELQGIVSYEPSELVVTVRAGTPLAELDAALLEKNQCLPFEPPHFDEGTKTQATVGGMVAAGLSGPSRATAGAVKDFVLGVRFINGRGEHLTFGGQVMKNVAGYDVSRLLAGSWGTLGVITEVSLKVLAFAPSEATLMCGLPQDKALELLHRWGGQPLPLNASCWVHDTTASPPRDILFVRLRGAAAAVQAALVRMRSDVQALSGEAVVMDNAQAGPDWAACREQQLPFFTQAPSPEACLWRLSVPQTATVLELPDAVQSGPFIEWHGAQRWVWAPAVAASALHALAQRAGGHATLFRRPKGALANQSIQGAVFPALDAVQQRIQSALQEQCDPHGVFNTRRLNHVWHS
jgi:glycolate oxidase FAD binding subunit